MNLNLETERLVLRPPCMGDSDRLFELMSDTRLTKFLTWEAHTEVDTTIKVIQSLLNAQINDKGYHWCICIDDTIIGLVSLIDVKRQIRSWTLNRAELSYWVTPYYQGKGYATEASEAVINFGFNKLAFHKIIVAHAAENIESKKICTKLKFEQYAYEHDAFQKSQVWHDLIWYERINYK